MFRDIGSVRLFYRVMHAFIKGPALLQGELGERSGCGMKSASQRKSWGRENSLLGPGVGTSRGAEFASCFLELTWDGALVLSGEGRIVESNEAMGHLLGCCREDLVNLPLDELHPVSQYLRVTRVLENIEQTGFGELKETRLLRRDGSMVFVELRGRALSLEDHQGYCLLYRNVTERRECEVKQKRAEAQLRSVQKLESLGVLAKSTAHDFNNHLVGILGNAGLALLELKESHPVRNSIREIEASALKATSLTRQLLDYSSSNDEEAALVDLGELISGMGHLLEVTVSKKVVVSCEIDPDAPKIRGHRSQLQQVMFELLTNASESIGDSIGKIEIRIGLQKGEEISGELFKGSCGEVYDDYLYLEVRDSGDGMSSETLSRIFEPSFSSKANGRGIGLAAVSGIISSHKGIIDIQSALGEGTVVQVWLPVLELSLVDREVDEADLCQWQGAGTVLVVDDEEAVRSVAKGTSQRYGFDVLTARDGEEAVEIFEAFRDRIVAVLIDLTMPRLNGVEAVSRIRRLEPRVPVIVSSGYQKREATRRFVGIGPAQYIQKPYQTKDLAKELYIAMNSLYA